MKRHENEYKRELFLYQMINSYAQYVQQYYLVNEPNNKTSKIMSKFTPGQLTETLHATPKVRHNIHLGKLIVNLNFLLFCIFLHLNGLKSH